MMYFCESALEAQRAGTRAAANKSKTKQSAHFKARDVRRPRDRSDVRASRSLLASKQVFFPQVVCHVFAMVSSFGYVRNKGRSHFNTGRGAPVEQVRVMIFARVALGSSACVLSVLQKCREGEEQKSNRNAERTRPVKKTK